MTDGSRPSYFDLTIQGLYRTKTYWFLRSIFNNWTGGLKKQDISGWTKTCVHLKVRKKHTNCRITRNTVNYIWKVTTNRATLVIIICQFLVMNRAQHVGTAASWMSGVCFWPGPLLCGICMFSLRLLVPGFSLGTPASSPSPMTCTLDGCLSLCAGPGESSRVYHVCTLRWLRWAPTPQRTWVEDKWW